MACDIITRCELDDVKNKVVWRGWHIDYLLTLCERHLSSPSPQQWHASLVDLLNIVLLREDLVREFGRNLYHRVNYNYLAMQMFIHTFSISADKAEILKNVHAAFANYLVETYQTPDLLDHSFYLHILYFLDGHMSAMQYSISVHTSGVTSWLHLPIWHLILRTAHTALQNYNGLYVGLSTELFQIAHSILQRIDHLDDQWSIKRGDGGPRVDPDPAVDFNGWAEEFNVNAAFFSDELIIDLVRFMPSAAEANVSRRVRRLELLWSKEGETHTPGRRSPGGRRGFQYAWSETDEAPPLPLPVAPVPVTPTQAPTIPSNPLQRVAPKRANTFMPLQAIPEDVAESSGSGSNGVVSTVPQAEAGSGSMTAANSRLPAEGNDANGTGEPGAQTSGVNGVGQQEHRGTLPTIVLHPPEPEPPILMYIPKAPQSDVVDRGPGGEPGGTGVGPGVGNGPGGVGNGPGGIGNGPGGIGDGPAGIGNGPAGMGNGSGGSGQEGMEGGTG
ncbi:hypothetical protein BDW22DRAFT_465286 [Trametopsis cervina]|nr:hypothetical protein BDW22DRAFT_465286 [Trametopsis cervina]